jgi:hypothetical protein
MQPEGDHASAGVYCRHRQRRRARSAMDVDGGCTTLVSPTFDLSIADRAFVRYWRWYGEGGNSADDDFVVQISSNGSTWVQLESVANIANSWTLVNEENTGLVPLAVQFPSP